jgi:S-DNA-T family DNA segregation ATPase FtsK/SpoIIIE
MAKKNKLKEPTEKEKKSPPKPAGKGFWSDMRTRRIGGLLIILACLYLLLALTSYLFTWKADQSMLSDSWWKVLHEGNYDVENWLGPLGAMVGHTFVHQWFGITSFLILPILFAIGYRILLRKHPYPFWKTTAACISAMLIFSPLLAFVFTGESWQIMGGAFGFYVDYGLQGVVGTAGTGAMLAFLGIAYIIAVFNPPFNWLGSVWQWLLTGVRGLTANVAEAAAERKALAAAQREKQQFEDTIGQADRFTPSPADVAMGQVYGENEGDAPSDDEDDAELFIVEDQHKKPNTPQYDLEVEGAYNDETSDAITLQKPENFELISADDSDEAQPFSVEIPATEKELTEEELHDKLQEFGEYDPTLDLASYRMPGLELLNEYGGGKVNVSKEELEENKNKIVNTLANYKIGIERIKATIGPTVTLYEIVPEPGIRISKIKSLEDDIALSLAALGIRIIAPIPGKGTIGIEVPNSTPDTVSMRSLIASEKFQNGPFDLPIALGKTIQNETFVTDLAKMPHLLMAGATGQGKSVGLNAILVSLLYKKHPSQIKFVLVDPKKVELTLYNKIERHYLAKLPGEEEAIITDTSKVVRTLNSLCLEMDERYELLKNAGVRNIKEYNAKFINRRLNPEKGHRYLPYIVLVVDEFADLIMTAGKEVETPIARLAQLARAIGIHLIIATQRPSVNIITGVIKANFPARVAFRVSSKIDSRTILDAGGADQLIGRGDMLLSTGNDLIRLQCGFVDTPEIDEITEFIGSQRGYPSAMELPRYDPEDDGAAADFDMADRDPMFDDAARMVVMHQQGSTSLIQRKLKLGYNRAGRIMDQLEAAGVVGPFEGSKARQVLITDEYALEQFLKSEAHNMTN